MPKVQIKSAELLCYINPCTWQIMVEIYLRETRSNMVLEQDTENSMGIVCEMLGLFQENVTRKKNS